LSIELFIPFDIVVDKNLGVATFYFNVDAIQIESMVFLLLIPRYFLPFSFSFDFPPFLFFFQVLE